MSIQRAITAAVAGLASAAVMAAAANAQSQIRDEEIESMVREFAEPIIESAGLRPEDVRTYLIGDPSMNAFVTGGQNIFLHTGIIVASERPIELKGVIAHETGHIKGAHLARQGEGQRAATLPMIVSMAAGIAAVAAGEGAAGAAILGSSQQFAMLEYFQYTQGQESAADQAAVTFLERTGQSGVGLISFFDRFRAQEIFSESRRFPYFRSHPLSSNRVEALRSRVADQPHADAVDPPDQIKLLERAQAKIHGFLDPAQSTFYRYPESDTSTNAVYARSIAFHKVGMLDKSISLIDELIDREPENPYFWELKGQVFYENGRANLAADPYRRAIELRPDSALFHTGLAQALVETDDDATLDEAMANVTLALRAEPNNGLAWYVRSVIHERRGETAMAQLSIAEQSYAVGNLRRAAMFAQRAQTDLEKGTPQWYRAADIVMAAANVMDPEDGRRRR